MPAAVTRTAATYKGGDIRTIVASPMAEALDGNVRSVALILDLADLHPLLRALDGARDPYPYDQQQLAKIAAAIRETTGIPKNGV